MGGATLAVRRTLAATRADARPASLRAGDVAVDVVADDRLDVDVVREAEARRLQMTQATDSVPTARQGRPILPPCRAPSQCARTPSSSDF